MSPRRISTGLAAVLLASTLAACGGSSHDDGASGSPPPPAGGTTPPPSTSTTTPPASASASVDGFVAYMKSLLGLGADGTAPIDVSSFVPPTSETSSPAVVQ